MVAPNINLEVAERQIMMRGPSRLLMSPSGDITSPSRLRADYGITRIVADIIFIRADGWSLGAPERLETVAYDMWKDDWIGFMRRPSQIATPIREYEAGNYAK